MRKQAVPEEFSKIVILQSLQSHERATGWALCEYLKANFSHVPVEFHDCQTLGEFENRLRVLKDQAVAGEIPLLHIECHGDSKSIEMADGLYLTMASLRELLLEIHRACDYKLIVTTACCFSGLFIEEINPTSTAPCWAVVGPSDTVFPDEIERGYREFFRVLLTTYKMEEAINAIKQVVLQDGQWLGENAEFWFIDVVVRYMERDCTKKALKNRAYKQREKLIVNGYVEYLHKSKNSMRNAVDGFFKQRNWLDDYFKCYFDIEHSPQNAARYANVNKQIRKRGRELASDSRYDVVSFARMLG